MENRIKGFTLIEVVLYLALFTLVIGVIIQFFMLVSQRNVNAKNSIELSTNALFLSQTFNSLKKETNQIDFNTSVINTDSSRLELTTASGDISIYLENGVLYILEDSVPVRVTVPNITVSRFRLSDVRNQSNTVVGYTVLITLSHNYINNSNIDYEFVYSIN